MLLVPRLGNPDELMEIFLLNPDICFQTYSNRIALAPHQCNVMTHVA